MATKFILKNDHGYYLVGWLTLRDSAPEPIKRYNAIKEAIVFSDWDQAETAMIQANSWDRLQSQWYGKWEIIPFE